MANAADSGPNAGSNLVSGAGTNSVTFTLPGSPRYLVQSVVATVDNTAGGATTATLTYADTNGEVIAQKAQGATIAAGDTGTATFALRLSDDSNLTAFLHWGSNTDTGNAGLVLTTTQPLRFDAGGATFLMDADSSIAATSQQEISLDAGGGQSTLDLLASGDATLLATNLSLFQFGNTTITTTGTFTTAAGELVLEIKGAPSYVVKIVRTAGVDKLGFFGTAPVAKQAAPVVLADVIAILQAFGLCA